MALAVAVVLGLVTNELSDISPWVARKLVAWSARERYGGTERAAIRAEELAALINERPGKLFKLGTGLRFASSALVLKIRRFVTGAEPLPPSDDIAPRLLDDEPTALVSRYLFPTERYRGEWKRHWVHLLKSLLIAILFLVLGIWAAKLRIKPEYANTVVWVIVGLFVLWLPYRWAAWYFGRFVITNKRIMSTEGVLFRQVAMIPLLRVTDVRYEQTPLGRVFGYGTFKLESASRRNALRKIADLPNPNELYLRLVEEMYEPDAVEARIGHDADARATDPLDFDELFLDGDLDISSDVAYEPPAEAISDAVVVAHIAELSRNLEALTAVLAALARRQAADQPAESSDAST
jgi:membrane protein YdbS with pleckstrin-like domain